MVRKKFKEKDPLVKFIQKKIRVYLKEGIYVDGTLVLWDNKILTIQFPIKFDWKGSPEVWKLLDIERYKIAKIILIDIRKEYRGVTTPFI